MAVLGKLKDFLDRNRVSYDVLPHPEVYTAQEIAAAIHVPGQRMAKVVMVRTKDRFLMAVLPASWRVDLRRMREILGTQDLRLASESEFRNLFPDCDAGAEPPFGNLYQMDVYVDRSLIEDGKIFFNAGTHVESIGMTYSDFARLVKPRVADFAVHAH